MAITSIGNDSGGLIAAEVLQRLETDLGNALATPNRPAANSKPASTPLTTSQPALPTSQPEDSIAPPMNDMAVSYTPDIGRSISNSDQANFIASPGASPRAFESTHDPVQVAAAQTVALMNLMSATNAAPVQPVIADGKTLPPTGIVRQQTPLNSSVGFNPAPPLSLPPQSLPPQSAPQQYSPATNQSSIANPARSGVPGANKVNDSGNVAQASPNVAKAVPNVVPRISDVAAVLMSEVASSDVAKLAKILDPSPDPANNLILDSLLLRAVQEVAKGNAERAVGYLADYATREPRRGEALPLEPDLAPVRDKIDSMVTRMTIVAKMTAEDGLSRAEQTASQNSGKISNWDTRADVLLKLAHRFFEAGGYANYSRTSELARVVSEAIGETKLAGHALAASAAASAASVAPANQLIPGVNVPYWASADVPPVLSAQKSSGLTPRRLLASPLDDLIQNLLDLKAIATSAIALLWMRAPLLVLMLFWLSAGIVGGVGFVIVSHTWPDSSLVVAGNFAFNLWGLGFLALVGAGFYARIRHRR